MQSWGGPGDEAGFDVAVNNLSEIFVIGQFFGTVDFDPGTGIEEHTSYGGDDCFISAFQSIDEFEWTGTWGSPNNDRPHGVTTDKSDNCYIVGEFWETADMDPGGGVEYRTSNGRSDCFLIKLDPNGGYLWSQSWGGSSTDQGNQGACDATGNVFVCGRFADQVDFNPGLGIDNHAAVGRSDAFLLKLSPDGTW